MRRRRRQLHRERQQVTEIGFAVIGFAVIGFASTTAVVFSSAHSDVFALFFLASSFSQTSSFSSREARIVLSSNGYRSTKTVSMESSVFQ